MVAALLFSLVLALIAIVSLRKHFASLSKLKSQAFASDDREYLRSQARRRIVISGLLLVLACMLAWAYLSGLQQRFDAISELSEQVPPQEPTLEDRQFVKYWTIYWIVSLGILFVMILGAIIDYVAVALYARSQFRRIAHEQQELLDRDLAMYRQAKLNSRMNHRRE
jgi:uncharacterized BrkB/YihY/UPF0761 family membrane protein